VVVLVRYFLTFDAQLVEKPAQRALANQGQDISRAVQDGQPIWREIKQRPWQYSNAVRTVIIRNLL